MQDPTIPTNQPPASPTMPPASAVNGVVPPAGSAAPTPLGTDSMNMQSSPVSAATPPQPAGGSVPADSLSAASSPAAAPASPSAPAMDAASKDTKDTKDAKAAQPEKRDTAKSGQVEVKKTDIEKVVSNWTGIPITKLTEDEGAKLLNLEKRIHQRLIDQEEAVTAVSEAVRRGRIGLASANRPIASFIFLGPSGTGKTELAKTLAEILFGKDDALIRLDMSEYMEKHEVAKLIGAPPGYVGYEEGGQLTEAVRAKPYSIVLLDEVEKAHPDVFNILLQVLEDGRLTDNKGNTISFKNTIVICTSNIGSALITQKLGEKEGKELNEADFNKEFAELTTLVSGELRKFFRPELLNRFDDIVIFKPLRRQDMAAIAKLGIEKTSKLLKEQDIKLKISEKALSQLAMEGYDPVYGARPLRRLIQTSIENPIAVLIIAKTFVAGDTIMIDYDQAKSDYSFRKATPEEIAAADKKVEESKQQKPNGQPEQKAAGSAPLGNTPPAFGDAPKNPGSGNNNNNGNGIQNNASMPNNSTGNQSMNTKPNPSSSPTPPSNNAGNGVGVGQGVPPVSQPTVKPPTNPS